VTNRFLAFDLGAESGRVMAGMFDGQHVRLEELHRFSNGPVNVAGLLRAQANTLRFSLNRKASGFH